MAVTEAKIGYGTLLKKGNGASPEVFTTVKEITGVQPPQSESDEHEVSHMESPGKRKEYIAGMIESGEVAGKCNWLPLDGTQDHNTGLLADQQSGVVRNWQIVTPDADLVWNFSGFVKSFNPDEIEPNKPMTASIAIKVTGASSFA